MSQKGLVGSWRFQEQMVNVGAELSNSAFTDLNGTCETFDGASRAGFHCISDGGDVIYIPTSEDISVVAGATYVVSFDVTGKAGASPQGIARQNRIGGTTYSSTAIDDNGHYQMFFTAETTETICYYFYRASSSVEFTIGNFTVKQASISDLTPQGNELSIYGASFTTDRKGRADSALSFDGTDDRATTTGLTGETARTAIIWAKLVTGSGGKIVRLGGSGNIDFNGSNGIITPQGGYTGDITYVNGVATTSGNLDSWNHVAVTFDAYTLGTIWVASDGVASYAELDIDSVKLFDRVLTPAEVLAEYNTYQPDGALNTGSLEKGLVAHFPLRSEYNKVGDEVVDGWTNKDFDAFTSDGLDITQMVSGTNGDNCYDAISAMSVGRSYHYQFNSSTAHGSNMYFSLSDNENIVTTRQNVVGSVQLENEGTLVASQAWDYVGFIGNSAWADTQISNFALKPLLSADITPQGNHAEVWGADVQAEYTEFDGTSHYFNSNINPNSLFGDGGIFSISCWCYNEGTASVNEYIAGAMDSSSNRFYFRNQDGYYRWGYGATATTNTAAAVVNSQWQFVTFAYDGAIMRTYLDGILVNSFSITVQTITSKDLHIGVLNNNGFPENYFDGRLDSFRFYSRALSATEVLALYNKGRN